MSMGKSKITARQRRHGRVRSKIRGTAGRPRLSVFRSARHIYAQLIDDEKGATLSQFNDLALKGGASKKTAKQDCARLVGKSLGEILVKKGVEQIVFDRGGYKYHGRVKALAEGLREAGVKF